VGIEKNVKGRKGDRKEEGTNDEWKEGKAAEEKERKSKIGEIRP
jgi:hypothetical protein